MRFLTPTDNKRLNELIGFLCITAGHLDGPCAYHLSAPRHCLQCERPGLGRRNRAQLDWARLAPMAPTSSSKCLASRRFCSPWRCWRSRDAVVPQPEHRFAGGHRRRAMYLMLLSLPCIALSLEHACNSRSGASWWVAGQRDFQ